MEDFNTLVERYMQCDKRTLAELLALKELCWYPRIQDPPQSPQPYVFPTQPWPQQPWTIGDGPWITYTTSTIPKKS